MARTARTCQRAFGCVDADGLIGIDGTHGFPNRTGHRKWVGTRPQDHIQGIAQHESVRHVDRRRRRLMETDIGCVAHDTDYFEPAVAAGRRQPVWVGWLDVIGHSDAPSDRGFVRPTLTSHRLIDDGDVGRPTAL